MCVAHCDGPGFNSQDSVLSAIIIPKPQTMAVVEISTVQRWGTDSRSGRAWQFVSHRERLWKDPSQLGLVAFRIERKYVSLVFAYLVFHFLKCHKQWNITKIFFFKFLFLEFFQVTYTNFMQRHENIWSFTKIKLLSLCYFVRPLGKVDIMCPHEWASRCNVRGNGRAQTAGSVTTLGGIDKEYTAWGHTHTGNNTHNRPRSC